MAEFSGSGASTNVRDPRRPTPRVDTTFGDHVIVPGFIAQHDHPVLAALTMSSEILAIEDWVAALGDHARRKGQEDFRPATEAVEARTDPNEPVLTWGYHPAFFGPLTRADLDAISAARPIVVWGRSCHEFLLNSATLKRAGVTQAVYDNFPASAKAQSNFDEGNFWEQGLFAVLPYIAPMIATPERLQAGLEISRDYMHAKGLPWAMNPAAFLQSPCRMA